MMKKYYPPYFKSASPINSPPPYFYKKNSSPPKRPHLKIFIPFFKGGVQTMDLYIKINIHPYILFSPPSILRVLLQYFPKVILLWPPSSWKEIPTPCLFHSILLLSTKEYITHVYIHMYIYIYNIYICMCVYIYVYIYIYIYK